MTGAFVAVVGASGAGKDSIIAAARSALHDRCDVRFPRRSITRPDGPGERHEPMTEEAFAAAAESRGAFALTWRAHGLAYGLPIDTRDAVGAGAIVVANVSRATLGRLGAVFDRTLVVRVSVADDVRLARILARGREDAVAASTRAARPDPAPAHPVDLEIVNDRSLAEAGALLTGFLQGVRAHA